MPIIKKALIILIILIIILIVGHIAVVSEGPLRDKMVSDYRWAKLVSNLDEVTFSLKKALGRLFRGKVEETPPEKVALHFKDGSIMKGELVSEDGQKYVINWEGTNVVVYNSQIACVERGLETLEKEPTLSDEEIFKQWPYKNDIVVRLTNRVVIDAEISQVGKDKLTLLYPVEGGGRIEQDIERSRVEYLIFKPVDNENSRRVERALKTVFSKMKFYRQGGFTILTDSYITWVKEYKKVLREQYTNLYLTFFEVFKDRRPKIQNFLVIFDDHYDFIEYAISDGVPGWVLAGYFSPEDEILYLYNVLGDRSSEILFKGFVGETGRTMDEIVEKVEDRVDKRYHIFINGLAKQIKDKFWEAYTYYKGMYRESTMNTLRHEFTHEIFHNWGLQSIKLSRYEKDKEDLRKKKKELVETKDCKKKSKFLRTLLFLGGETLDVRAANSWLAEGTATYCETDPMGSQNNRWLYIYQDMVSKGPIYPLESLTYHRIGSFPGVAPLAMLQLYAESWAFVTFLMEKYPKEFMEYQNRMTEETAEGQEDIDWLLEAVGKDLKTLQKEFEDYMKTYPKIDSPYIRHLEKMRSIFRD